MKIINVRKQPEYTEKAIKYFQSKWASEESMKVYEDSITRSVIAKNTLPIWYLLEEDEKIAGCAGLINNDFISCSDLWPWLCSLYIEEEYRGNALSNLLITQIKADAKQIGFENLYLCTDHIGLYEKYDFKYICDGYHPFGLTSRVYEHIL